MTWTIPFIAVCWLLVSPSIAQAAECRFCHNGDSTINGAHSGLKCHECHQSGAHLLSDPADRSIGSAGCVQCHRGYQRIYAHPMGNRAREKAFISRTYGTMDKKFEQKNCSSCHIGGCTDCHGNGHNIARPKPDACSACHKGYYVGWDYFGRAPREEHERYQRGETAQGETWLKMLPDVHHQKGMSCNDCHTMSGFMQGKVAAKHCTDCHRPSKKILEHRIPGHLEKLECATCHAAWAPQEYGTFYLQFATGSIAEPFQALTAVSKDYVKSVYIKRQDLPPLGINSRGKIAPIRPQFIAYYSLLANGRAIGQENHLLAAEWRAFNPHTIQRGAVMCDGCHDNPRRFLLEPIKSRIYDLQKEGMTLHSFWNQSGQTVVNGSFMDQERYNRMSNKSSSYKKAYVEKWKTFIGPAPSLFAR